MLAEALQCTAGWQIYLVSTSLKLPDGYNELFKHFGIAVYVAAPLQQTEILYMFRAFETFVTQLIKTPITHG